MDTTKQVWYTPIVLGYIERGGAVLLARRPAGAHQAGRWEFPGGKVEPGETMTAALRRECREELGIAVDVGEEIAQARYCYPDRCVALHLFRCRLPAGEPVPRQVAEVRWTPVGELPQIDFPPANAALLAQLAATRPEPSTGDAPCE